MAELLTTEALVESFTQSMDMGLALSIDYDGLSRIVEPHAIGTNKAGRLCVRAYQVQGGSIRGEAMGWRMFDLSKIYDKPKLLDVKAEGPRDGYQRGDKHLPMIIKEL